MTLSTSSTPRRTAHTFQITEAEFALFSRFLEQNCGILLAKHKQYLVQSRLGRIMQEQGFSTLQELVTRISSPAAGRLREQVIDAMTTNETLWFRDNHPYEILAQRLLPELAERARFTKLRIWSAACSSGQEPYSVSMVIDEFKSQQPGKLSGGEEIVATDISTDILAQARRGRYETLALGRGLSRARLERFFDQQSDGSWSVKAAIKSRVRFQNLNLLGPYATLGQFDIIFCRNVLIYFSAERKAEILRKMHKALKPGGYLLLGASESLSGLNDHYRMIHCRPGIIYQAI